MLSVVTPTWRIGGLDVMSQSLIAACADGAPEFEWVVADALYPWRADVVDRHRHMMPFEIKHVPVQNNLFPVMSPFRTRNSGVRAASGERVIFATDYSVVTADFLKEHARLADDEVGLAPYVQLEVPVHLWKIPVLWKEWTADTTWKYVKTAVSNPSWNWSTMHSVPDPSGLSPRTVPSQPCPLLDPKCELPPSRYDFHWKSDSASLRLLRQVNGFDASYDGHDWGDQDLTVRVARTGARFARLTNSLQVLDPHPVLYCTVINDAQDNRPRLDAVVASGRTRCRYGLVYDDSVPWEIIGTR